MDKYIGKKLDGRYQLQQLIGVGGMAYVYKATDLLNGSTVAVKILKDEFLENEELLRRFKNESRAIGILDHENIVKVLDVNFSESVQFIVMEYLDGITLKDYIKVNGALPWRSAIYFARQLLKALQHAHDRGIIHRDIKPQNVMLLESGKLKVMDFGIARFSRSGVRTLTDKAIGTVHYISPEQARGEQTDAKSDIYSVGVMLYEMCTGKLPFDSDSAVSVAVKQISDAPTPPRELNDAIPSGLEEIILKAMEKDPSRRYQSAGMMLQDIENLKKDPGISFDYKYLSGDSPTIYIDHINHGGSVAAAQTDYRKDTMAISNSEKTKVEKKQTAAKTGSTAAEKKTENKKEKKAKIVDFPIALFMGITAACVIGAVILVVMTLNMNGSELFANHVDVKLPDFVGQKLRDVQADSRYSLFNFQTVEAYNSEYEAGVIYDQSPNPPKTVKDNARITLYVSKGTQIVTVPDNIVGSSYGDAVRTLQALGLVVTRKTDNNSEFAGNTITKIEPESGKAVESGSEIVIYVNSPNTTLSTYVPSVIGLDFTTAKATLSINGLRVGNMVTVDSDVAMGTVVGQSIDEGVRVANGTAIDLIISSGVCEKECTFKIALPYADPSGNTTFTVEFYIGSELVDTEYGVTKSSGAHLTRSGVSSEYVSVRINGVDYATLLLNYQEGTVTVSESFSEENGFTETSLYTVSFSANDPALGSVTVSGSTAPVKVTSGGSCTVTISPSADCHIVSVTDNGADVTSAVSGGSYTISSVTGDHSITVTFAADVIDTPDPVDPPVDNEP